MTEICSWIIWRTGICFEWRSTWMYVRFDKNKLYMHMTILNNSDWNVSVVPCRMTFRFRPRKIVFYVGRRRRLRLLCYSYIRYSMRYYYYTVIVRIVRSHCYTSYRTRAESPQTEEATSPRGTTMTSWISLSAAVFRCKISDRAGERSRSKEKSRAVNATPVWTVFDLCRAALYRQKKKKLKYLTIYINKKILLLN